MHGYCMSCKAKKPFVGKTTSIPMPNGTKMIQGQDALGHNMSAIAKSGGAIDPVLALKAAEKGLDFTSSVLKDDTRVRRVEMRQDGRDDRRTGNINRQNERKDSVNRKKVAKQDRKTSNIDRKEAIKDAKHQRRLNKYK